MNWKKYTRLFISALCILALVKYAYSCIAGIIYYDYPSFFGNKATEKPAYRPYFYTGNDLFYNNIDDKNQDNTDLLSIANLKEWKSYTQENISLKDIGSVLNEYSLKDIIGMSKGQNVKHATVKASNTFEQWILRNKSPETINYLLFAKLCEPYVYSQSSWDTLTVNKDSSEILIKKGLNDFAKTENHFLKMRYAFQVIRLAFYNNQNDRTFALYDKLIGNVPDSSLMFYRCLGFKAGVYFRKKNYAQAAYLYSRIFDASDALKHTAMISFLWSINNGDGDKNVSSTALQLCKSNHEQAVITVMLALREYNEGLPKIQTAYALDPKIGGIDVLVNREINKMEERFQADVLDTENGISYGGYSGYFDGQSFNNDDQSNDSIKASYPKYLNRLNDFVLRVASEKKNGSIAFWHLASGYIQYMLHNTSQMTAQMKLAYASKMNNQETQLYHVIKILYTLQNHPKITAELENELLPQLKALDILANESSDQENNFKNIMNYLLTPKYLKQKDTAKAIYCLAHSQRQEDFYGYGYNVWQNTLKGISAKYFVDENFQDRPGIILDRMTIEGLHTVQQFEESNSKTPFEAWLVSLTYYDKNVLAELEGTKYLRASNFKSAEFIFSKIPHLDSLSYPFEMRINDYTDTVYRQDTAILTNKYTFARQMSSLKDTLQKNPTNAPALYKYALGLYNMSYYGRSAHLFTYYQGSSDRFKYYRTKERDKLPYDFQEYYGLYNAEKYFNLAAKAATNATLKAKCIFGAAKCWQKRCPLKDVDEDADGSYMAYSLKNPYFKTLKEEYATNTFTKEVYSTCSYFRDYVKKK